MAKIFVLYGPQGIGKSANASVIAGLLDCKHILENWNGNAVIHDDTLAVTNCCYRLPAGAVGFTVESHAGLEALITLLQRQAA
jgi:ABC-type sulfate/molybdate transport systems ATPase subunit